MKLLTIDDEIKDIDDRIEKSMSELYVKASDYKTGRSRYNGIMGIIIGSIFLFGCGSMLLGLPINALETNTLCAYIAATLSGAIITGGGIAIVANSKKNANKILSEDELKYIVERGSNIEIKEMYDRVGKLFVIREHLIEKKNDTMVSTDQVSTSIEQMKQPEEPIREVKRERTRKR